MREICFFYSYKFGNGNYIRGKKIYKYFLKNNIKIKLKKFQINNKIEKKNIYDLHTNDLLKLKNKKILDCLIINSFDNNTIENCINIMPEPSKNFHKSSSNVFKGEKYLISGIDFNKKLKNKFLYDFYLFLGMDKDILKKTKIIFDRLNLRGFKIFSPCINKVYIEGDRFIKNILSCRNHIISGGLMRYDLMELGIDYNYIGINTKQNNINKMCKKFFDYGNCLGTINKYNLEKIKFFKKKKAKMFNGEQNIYNLYVQNIL